MEISPALLRAGDLVRIRRRRWRVVDVQSHETCRLLTVAGVDAGGQGSRRRYLTPFDTVEHLDGNRRPRAVSRRCWRRACRALLADHTPPEGMRCARFAEIDLLPHQLEPALAAVRGLGSRFLLADEVGLGKTIQAGLVLAELRARGVVERALILTPAGLREQWLTELERRFGLQATIVDARGVRRRCSELPAEANPWSTIDVAIASIDFVKRLEVLAAVGACRWDLLIVDEAHGVSSDSDRHVAVGDLAKRAAFVLLLTATPHDGDRRTFQSLCDLGARGDPLLVFRRSRFDVHLGLERRIRRLLVRPSASERRMHALVERFSRAVREEWKSRVDAPGGRDKEHAGWLTLAVLTKRSLSSAWSLEQTVERRLRSLGMDQPSTASGRSLQLALPIADPEGETSDADGAPDLGGLALEDPARERAMLEELASAARAAARRETKIAALIRFLRRVGEPAVVFTEYRDTLLHVQRALGLSAAVLHGGLGRGERAAAIADFVGGRRLVLLATDAAGEGLNLHHACRLVVNLELPWNPMRLEQRIGRVDRIGQQRTVHAVHLIARDTAETRVLNRLRDRIANARSDITTADPLGGACSAEESMARFVLGGTRDEPSGSALPDFTPIARSAVPDSMVAVALRVEATAEAARLAAARRFAGTPSSDGAIMLAVDRPWVARQGIRATRAALGSRLLLMVRIGYEDACGRLVESTLVPLLADFRHGARLTRRRQILALVEAIAPDAMARADASAAAWKHAALASAAALARTRLARARTIWADVSSAPHAAYQPGLFDRRAERRQLEAYEAASQAARLAALRLGEAERGSIVQPRPPELLLVLAPW